MKTDILIKPLLGGAATRVTLDGDYNRRPSWTADGRQVTFIKGRPPGGAVWQRPADLSEPARLLLAGPPAIFEAFWSPQRDWLLYRTDDDGTATQGDILAVRPGIRGTPRTLVGTEYEEVAPALSPDGSWLAYVSAANGHKEVYVRSFSDAGAGPWPVSEGGGTEPTWLPFLAAELFYRNGAGEMVSAIVRTDPIFSVVKRESLFDATPYLSNGDHRWYAISADDQQFLMLRAPGTERLSSWKNLFTELKKKFLR